jgi:hypothetical protein
MIGTADLLRDIEAGVIPRFFVPMLCRSFDHMVGKFHSRLTMILF